MALEPIDGSAASTKPPVRIFLGTASAAYRAERMFMWSLLQHRDPARAYEIYFVKDLDGHRRSAWAADLGAYCDEVAAWAGGQGRAIYNTVGYVYRRDPGELFDLPMDGNAALRSDRGVALLDCAALGNGASDQGGSSVGPLPADWDVAAGDATNGNSAAAAGLNFGIAGIAAGSDLIAGPVGASVAGSNGADVAKLWRQMEAEADGAGFTVFTKDEPSDGYRDLVALYRRIHEEGASNVNMTAEKTFDGKNLDKHTAPIAKLVADSGVTTVLDYGSGKGRYYDVLPGAEETDRIKAKKAWGEDVRVTCYDPGYEPFSEPVTQRFGGVVTTDVVEHIMEEDIPWVLDEIFGYADKFVYIVAACYLANKTLADGRNAHVTVMEPEWWKMQVECAARRRPGLRWMLCTEEKTLLGKKRVLHSNA